MRPTVALAFRAGPSPPSCGYFQDKYQEVLGTQGGFLAVLLECLQFRVPHDDHLLEPGNKLVFLSLHKRSSGCLGRKLYQEGTVHHEAGGRHTGPSAFARCQGFGDYLGVMRTLAHQKTDHCVRGRRKFCFDSLAAQRDIHFP